MTELASYYASDVHFAQQLDLPKGPRLHNMTSLDLFKGMNRVRGDTLLLPTTQAA